MKFFDSISPQEVSSWKDIYTPLKTLCQDNRQEAGAAFEQFCKAYYLFEPTVKDQYKNVWHGQEAPLQVLRKLNLGIAEHGRDLILEDKEGLFSLVQCKFKTDQDEILSWSKDKIANLFAEGDKAEFVVVFTNASGLDKYSREKKARQLKLITLGDLVQIQPETLRQMVSFLQGHPSEKQSVHFTPRPDQAQAVKKVLEGYKTANRGQLILPCGSGKTLTSLWIKEAINPNHTLVLVPSLALLRQFKNEWARNQKEWFPYLCVCSEKDIDRSGDVAEVHTYEIGGRVTTSPDEIKSFLDQHHRAIIYATYQSLEAIRQAIKRTSFTFDFAICDEAHKTAGAHSTEFAKIHKDATVPVQKRLYMTATPRVRSRSLKVKDDEEELIADMSNQEIYGPIFYRMSFKEAIELGILVDYKIIAIGVSDAELQQAIHKRHFADHKGETVEDYANNYALQKLMQKYPATHAITFHSTVKRAERFKDRHRELMPDVYSEHVNGGQTTNTRNLIMEAFKNAEKGVVTNARCLTEGIDVPTIDAVYFCDPKNSIIDIVQASGRALRKAKHKDKPLGYIVVPIYHKDEELLESSIQSGPYKKLVDIIRALCDQDERLQAEINNIKLGKGLRNGGSDHIEIDVDEAVPIILEGFSDRLKKVLFDQIVEKSYEHWEFNFGLLKMYRESFPDHWPTARSEYGGVRLGEWCGTQRGQYRNKTLDVERIEKLNKLGFSWDPFDDLWQEAYDVLIEFRKKHPEQWPGDMELYEGFRLGRWCNTQRSGYKNKVLNIERIEKLNGLGFVWDPYDAQWQETYGILMQYRRQYPDRWPAHSSEYKGIRLGLWCGSQRRNYRHHILSEERTEKLNRLGYSWDPLDEQWQEAFDLLVKFREQNPHRWPEQREKYQGVKIGTWCHSQRQNFKKKIVSADQVDKLNKLGFNWDPLDEQWQEYYVLLDKYRKEFPTDWPPTGSLYQGLKLGQWCNVQRRSYKHHALTAERIEKLNKLGFPWDAFDDRWQETFDLLVEYRKQFSDRWPPASQEYQGVRLDNWCGLQRKKFRNKKLNSERIDMLNKLGFIWEPFVDRWQESYDLLVKFRKQFPDRWPTQDYEGVRLWKWCSHQRTDYSKHVLDAEKVDKLERLGFSWNTFDDRWQYAYDLLVKFRKQFPDRWPAHREICYGFRLGTWCQNQRTRRKRSILEDDRFVLLNNLGFSWDPLLIDQKWQKAYDLLVKYRTQYPDRWPPGGRDYLGFQLGNWCQRQRNLYEDRSLSGERIEKLTNIGFIWDPYSDQWQERYDILVKYRQQFPHRWPSSSQEYQGIKLGEWCNTQRRSFVNHTMNTERMGKLKTLGFSFKKDQQ